jgi:hypothetical protein
MPMSRSVAQNLLSEADQSVPRTPRKCRAPGGPRNNEQIVWMLKGKVEFPARHRTAGLRPRRRRGRPGGLEHEAWFRENTEVIDFFAPARTTSYAAANPPT